MGLADLAALALGHGHGVKRVDLRCRVALVDGRLVVDVAVRESLRSADGVAALCSLPRVKGAGSAVGRRQRGTWRRSSA